MTAAKGSVTQVDLGEIDRIVAGLHHDPHAILGAHPVNGGIAIRTLRPLATSVTVVLADGRRFPAGHLHQGVFAATLPLTEIPDYRLAVTYPGAEGSDYSGDKSDTKDSRGSRDSRSESVESDTRGLREGGTDAGPGPGTDAGPGPGTDAGPGLGTERDRRRTRPRERRRTRPRDRRRTRPRDRRRTRPRDRRRTRPRD